MHPAVSRGHRHLFISTLELCPVVTAPVPGGFAPAAGPPHRAGRSARRQGMEAA